MRATLIVGDTLDFLTTVLSYPPADGWTLKYRLVPRVSGTPIAITAATEGDHYRVQVGPTTTAAWLAGEYSWSSWVEKSGARVTVDDGTITLLPDPAIVTARDSRTHAAKVLDAIRAVIENRASLDQEEYTIGGRSLRRTPLSELRVLEQRYASRVANEEAAEALADGTAVARTVRVRF